MSTPSVSPITITTPSSGSTSISPATPATAPPMKIISTVIKGWICKLRPSVNGMNTKSSSRRTRMNTPIAE